MQRLVLLKANVNTYGLLSKCNALMLADYSLAIVGIKWKSWY